MEEDGKGGWGRVKRVMAGVWEEVERGGGPVTSLGLTHEAIEACCLALPLAPVG